MKRFFLSLACIAVIAGPPAEAKKTPQLTAMEIQALQTREYETSKEVLFASVVSVLQDLGYQLANADLSSGFITASSPTKNKTSFLDALAKQRASGNTKVTAFIEQMAGGTSRVRLNFINSKTTAGDWGGSNAEDKPILDPETYQVAWDKIDEAIFVRSATAVGGSLGPAQQQSTSTENGEPGTSESN